jgi:hypothetical protein
MPVLKKYNPVSEAWEPLVVGGVGTTGPQGPVGPAGPVGPGLVPRGVWSYSGIGTVYAVNDVVSSYDTATLTWDSYVCTVAHTQGDNAADDDPIFAKNNSPTAYWQVLVDDIEGPAGPSGPAGPAGEANLNSFLFLGA